MLSTFYFSDIPFTYTKKRHPPYLLAFSANNDDPKYYSLQGKVNVYVIYTNLQSLSLQHFHKKAKNEKHSAARTLRTTRLNRRLPHRV